MIRKHNFRIDVNIKIMCSPFQADDLSLAFESATEVTGGRGPASIVSLTELMRVGLSESIASELCAYLRDVI